MGRVKAAVTEKVEGRADGSIRQKVTGKLA